MFELTLVSIAVTTLIATKWENSPRWQLGIGGLLSFALGLRIAAVLTATYLLPGVSSVLWAQEPDVPSATASAEPQSKELQSSADQAAKDKSDAGKTEAGKSESAKSESARADTDKTLAQKPDAEKPDAEKPDAEKPDAEKPDAEKPVSEKPGEAKPGEAKPEAGKSEVEKAESETAAEPVKAKSAKEAGQDDPATANVRSTEPANSKAESRPSNGSESEPNSQTAQSSEVVSAKSRLVYLTPDRPSWLEAAPTYEGDLFKVSVRGGPYQTVRQCMPDLNREVSLAVADFVNDHLQAPHASNFFRYSLKDLRSRNILREQFSEQLETSVGLMSQVHAQLVFDDSFRDELDQRWSEVKAKGRLAQTGIGTGIVLLFLGTMFSFLKLDTVTRGYYTGRLQFVAAATILALVAASVLLMKWIPWM